MAHKDSVDGSGWQHLEDSGKSWRSSTGPAGATVNSASAAEDAEERSAKVVVEDGVQERIDGRVGVAEPEEERVQRPWDRAGGWRTPAGHNVDDEEADPHATEASDDDCHPDGRPHLSLFTEEPTETGPATESQHGRYGRPSGGSLGLTPR